MTRHASAILDGRSLAHPLQNAADEGRGVRPRAFGALPERLPEGDIP